MEAWRRWLNNFRKASFSAWIGALVDADGLEAEETGEGLAERETVDVLMVQNTNICR